VKTGLCFRGVGEEAKKRRGKKRREKKTGRGREKGNHLRKKKEKTLHGGRNSGGGKVGAVHSKRLTGDESRDEGGHILFLF
jgi:hypothetical protein